MPVPDVVVGDVMTFLHDIGAPELLTVTDIEHDGDAYIFHMTTEQGHWRTFYNDACESVWLGPLPF